MERFSRSCLPKSAVIRVWDCTRNFREDLENWMVRPVLDFVCWAFMGYSQYALQRYMLCSDTKLDLFLECRIPRRKAYCQLWICSICISWSDWFHNSSAWYTFNPHFFKTCIVFFAFIFWIGYKAFRLLSCFFFQMIQKRQKDKRIRALGKQTCGDYKLSFNAKLHCVRRIFPAVPEIFQAFPNPFAAHSFGTLSQLHALSRCLPISFGGVSKHLPELAAFQNSYNWSEALFVCCIQFPVIHLLRDFD